MNKINKENIDEWLKHFAKKMREEFIKSKIKSEGDDNK